MRSHFTCNDELEIEHIEQLLNAAENGDLESAYKLGAYLDMGDYCLPDKKKAAHIFRELAEKGHTHCQWIYATELLWGLGNFKTSVDEGLKYLDLAVDGGSAEACITKAGFFIKGEFGFPKNMKEAEYLRRLAKSYDESVYDPFT